jgi:hypothetical protein
VTESQVQMQVQAQDARERVGVDDCRDFTTRSRPSAYPSPEAVRGTSAWLAPLLALGANGQRSWKRRTWLVRWGDRAPNVTLYDAAVLSACGVRARIHRVPRILSVARVEELPPGAQRLVLTDEQLKLLKTASRLGADFTPST